MAEKDLYATFTARFVRYVAWAGVAVVTAGGLLVLWLAPGTSGRGYSLGNVVGVAVLLGGGCLFLWRQGTVSATVDSHGITVRNLLRTRTLGWEQVVGVTFGSGDPWVLLEISDGTTWPVMALQRADGAHAEREVARLRALVVLHGEAQER